MANFRIPFFTPQKRDYKASAFFLLVFEVWDSTAVFFYMKNHHRQPLGGHRVSVRGGISQPSLGWAKTMEKTNNKSTCPLCRSLDVFLKSPRWCSRTQILSIFLVNSSGNIPTPWILLGYLVSLTASKERISRLFSPGFQNRRYRPVKWCSALVFGGYIKIPGKLQLSVIQKKGQMR